MFFAFGCVAQRPINYDESDNFPDFFVLTHSKDDVVDFIKLFEREYGDYIGGASATNDDCYNITPKEIGEKLDFSVFKFDTSMESFVLYEGKIHKIGSGFGGVGLLSLHLSDFDEDGIHELIYTFSWGSGMHRTNLGYFDFSTKEETLLEYGYFDADIFIQKVGKNQFSLHKGNANYGDMTVSVNLDEKSYVADISLEKDGIKVTNR